jgi:hypothetical protein
MRHSRRWRSSPTSARCRGPRSRASEGLPQTSAVAGLVERGLIAEAGRDKGGGAIRYESTPLFERVFGLTGLSELPRSMTSPTPTKASASARTSRRPPRRVAAPSRGARC